MVLGLWTLVLGLRPLVFGLTNTLRRLKRIQTEDDEDQRPKTKDPRIEPE